VLAFVVPIIEQADKGGVPSRILQSHLPFGLFGRKNWIRGAVTLPLYLSWWRGGGFEPTTFGPRDGKRAQQLRLDTT